MVSETYYTCISLTRVFPELMLPLIFALLCVKDMGT